MGSGPPLAGYIYLVWSKGLHNCVFPGPILAPFMFGVKGFSKPLLDSPRALDCCMFGLSTCE